MGPADGVLVRPAGAADRDAVRAVVRTAFGDDGEHVADIVADLEASDLLVASLVAEVDGVLAGHVGLSRAWLDARDRLVEVWVLGPLSTLPDHQRRGAGTALLAAALAHAEQEGMGLVFLEGSPDFYAARGFDPARDHGFLPPSTRIPVMAFQVAVLTAYDGSTGRLVYPDVWWRHDAVGLRGELLETLETQHGRWE